MSVIGTIKSWFQKAALSKDDQLHQAHNGDKPPPKSEKPADTGGIGSAPTEVKEAEEDWKGDT